MDNLHGILIVAVAALITAALRFLPFLLFPAGKKMPRIITYLSTVLPGAIMAMLVVYCFKSTTVLSWPYALPEAIAAAVVVGLYLLSKNTLISIALGTIGYMLLVQLVFV